jgi:hypothetical protein
MLIDLDQNTLANMTAALDYVCKKIPPDRDSHEARKQIADAMIERASAGPSTYVDLVEVGSKVRQKICRPTRKNWFGWLDRAAR